MAPDLDARLAAIRNAGWLIRHYALQRTRHDRARRAEAIMEMGMAVREAFALSDDFEPLLVAVVDGLRPLDNQPF